MYTILTQMQGYTHFDFVRDDFTAAEYFLLVELIKEDNDNQQKQMKRAKRKK